MSPELKEVIDHINRTTRQKGDGGIVVCTRPAIGTVYTIKEWVPNHVLFVYAHGADNIHYRFFEFAKANADKIIVVDDIQEMLSPEFEAVCKAALDPPGTVAYRTQDLRQEFTFTGKMVFVVHSLRQVSASLLQRSFVKVVTTS